MQVPVRSVATRSGAPRRAFSLVEILVVIGIIAVLAALTTVGVFAMIGNTQRNNTNATIKLLNKLLQQRWDAVVADSRRESPSPQAMALAGGAMLDPTGERGKVIWTKIRLAEAFPQSYQEVRPAIAPAPPTLVDAYVPSNRHKPHWSKYRELLKGTPSLGSSPPTAAERSACLLMALNTLQAGGVALDDQIRHAVKDTDGDGMPELVDGWGKPIAFFRYPWNNPLLQQANPALANASNARGLKFSDPLDSNGTLMNAKWYNLAATPPALSPRQTFELQFHVIGPTAAPGSVPNNAFFVSPVLVSAGKDQNMTLNLDLSSGGTADSDNIYSFQLRGE